MQEENESKIELKVGQYLFIGTDPLTNRGWITKVTNTDDIQPPRGYRCTGILLFYDANEGQKFFIRAQFFDYPTAILYQLKGDRYLRPATSTEIRWLDACIKHNKLVEKPLGYLRRFLNHEKWK